MANKNYRADELKRRMEYNPDEDSSESEPKMAEVKVDVSSKDFDSVLDEVITKLGALVKMAPNEKKDKLETILEALQECQQEGDYAEEEAEPASTQEEEGPMGEANEMPPIQLG